MLNPQDLPAAFIGAGKIANSLAPAIADAGFPIETIISRSLNSAEVLSKKCGTKSYSDNINDLNKIVKLVVLSVPDSKILDTAKKLSKLPLSFSNIIFIHLSGSKTITELKPLADKSANIGSMHLMNTFPSKERVSLNNTFAAIESGSESSRKLLFSLAEKLVLRPFPVSSESKVYYHLIGVFSSNFLVSNFYNADIAKQQLNNSVPKIGSLAGGIAHNTLNNIESKGVTESISGPIDRGDVETVKSHLAALKDDKVTLLNYLASSLSLLDAVKNKPSASDKQLEEIQTLLIRELKNCINQF